MAANPMSTRSGGSAFYDLACTCTEYRTHGPLCRHSAASLLYVKRASAVCLTDADSEADRLRCETQQLRNQVRKLERQVQGLEEDLVARGAVGRSRGASA